MKIISMCTPSYLNWLYHFLHSATGEIVIYRINFSNKQKRLVEQEFPNVTFRDHKANLIPREKANPLARVFKVTYLKGILIKKAFEEFQDKILWCDVTELIIGDLNEFEEKFGPNGFRIKRGGEGKTKTFAAIFGLYGKREISRYAEMCDEKKSEWFVDQISLAELNLNEIEKGDWIDFHYSEKAKSWSDRGEKGSGTLTSRDYDFTENKYISFLEGKFQNYKENFNSFMQKLKQPTILIHTDAPDWCYVNSTNAVASILSDEFDFIFIHNAEAQKEELMKADPLLVWARCSSLRNKKLLRFRPDLRNKSFTSITTGGELLDDRVSRNVSNLTESGLITQNREAIILSSYYMQKRGFKKPIFLLENGCDIDSFKPKKKEGFVVGWNGRAGTPQERDIKGYNYYKKAVEILEYETLELGRDKKIPFSELPENFYDKISVLVLPSNCEGCSNTINEALAAGVPVMTYKVGYHGEVMKEYDDGVIWIERAVGDIAKKLQKLHNDRFLYETLSENARKWAERHSWGKISDKYRETFKQMIKHIESLPKEELTEDNSYSLNRITDKTKTILVKGIVETNLGKLEKNGRMLWFTPGMIREVPYYGEHKKLIDTQIKNKVLERLN